MTLKPENYTSEIPVSSAASTTGRKEENYESTPSSLHNPIEEDKAPGIPVAEFKPTKRLYVAFLTLAVITLMVALDGTSLSVALPVGLCNRKMCLLHEHH